MPTTPSMGMVLPTEGDSNDVWGMLLNAALTNRVDSHRHVSGQGLPVPLDGIVVDQDKLWGSGGAFYALTDFKAITWHQQPVASMSPYVHALFVSDGTGGLSAGELYWRTSLGVNVKITAANMLNVAGFAGGIGGDYTSAGAAVAYDDTAKQYTFREGIVDLMGWAKLRAGALRISPFNTVSSFFIEHTVDPAILGQYVVQWPVALPGSTQLMQVSSAGAVSFSNTVEQLVTGSLGFTAAVNQHFTVSGTGRYKHGVLTMSIAGSAAQPGSGTSIIYDVVGNPGAITFSGGSGIAIPITLPVGAQIQQARCFIRDNVTGPTTLNLQLVSHTATATTTIALSANSAGSGAAQTLTTSNVPTPVASGTGYALRIIFISGTSTCTLGSVEVDFDHP